MKIAILERPQTIDRIVKLYKSGVSSVKLAEEYETTPGTIVKHLRTAGVEIRSKGRYMAKLLEKAKI